MSLPIGLWEIKQEIEQYARDYQLDFFETIFELVDYKTMNEIAAYGGFPTRYNHWRFGMEYEQLSKSHEYGLSKIYEMVINNDPAYAYLLQGNNLVDQKTVIAHVYGHVDFFKNNFFFSKTNRKMVDEMANHSTRVRRYIDRYGLDKVEDFIETCLSLDNLIDFHAPYFPARARPREGDEEVELNEMGIPKLPTTKDYMENYINPESFLEEQRQKMEAEREKRRRIPSEPQKDVLQFLLSHAPLDRWESDVLAMVREEAYYFAPQGMTKIMNEGWACVSADSLVFTSAGLRPMKAVVEERLTAVSDGDSKREIYDYNVIPNHPTITVKTGRGFELTGSTNHRVRLVGGEWRRLDALATGDRLEVAGGAGLWPEEEVGERRDDALEPIAGLDAIPDAILRSPATVVRMFLRSLFDSIGDADAQGVVLSTSSGRLSQQAQLLMLNDGILSRRERQTDGGDWSVRVAGASAQRWRERVGFGRERSRARARLNRYLEGELPDAESWEDEVVSLSEGREDVYDISVRETHRYAACGLVNHNSYWHSTIMTQKALRASECIDYAESYAGIVATQPGQLNPYKLGIELFRDIEDRWNRGKFGKEYEDCDDLEVRDRWNRDVGQGREKIYQVRAIYSDITFIDEFLTEDFCRKHGLFTFAYNNKSGDYEIASREFREVKEKILFGLTNFGQPFIYVKDGNFKNRAELLLHHKFDGQELRLDYARDVLCSLYRVWKRPVNIETIIDGKGRLISYDGSEHRERAFEYEAI